MNTKGLRVEVKDADKGEVTAVFSTFGVVDHDGDVTSPGAFTDGAPVRMSAYQHTSWMGALPVGKGTIRVTATEAIFEGGFFMNTAAGRDTFEVVKEMGDLQEWSYGYDPIEFAFGEHDGSQVRFLNKVDAHEVSPVLKGAGLNTRTLAVKGDGLTFAEQARAVLAAVDELLGRAADVVAKRQEKGKGLGADSTALLGELDTRFKRLDELMRQPEPDTGALEREYLRFVAANRHAIRSGT